MAQTKGPQLEVRRRETLALLHKKRLPIRARSEMEENTFSANFDQDGVDCNRRIKDAFSALDFFWMLSLKTWHG